MFFSQLTVLKENFSSLHSLPLPSLSRGCKLERERVRASPSKSFSLLRPTLAYASRLSARLSLCMQMWMDNEYSRDTFKDPTEDRRIGRAMSRRDVAFLCL